MVLRLSKIFLLCAGVSLFGASAFAQVTMNSLDQNADQSMGQYMPMNMGYAGFNSLGMTQAAWLDPLQNLGEGQSRPAYSKYYWSPDLVLPVRLREGMMTLINFPEWELIEDMYIGDNATFDGQISGPNTILLYPRKGAAVGVDTNIILFGRSGNRYVFYAKSEGVNTERLTNSIIDVDVVGDAPATERDGGVVPQKPSPVDGHGCDSGADFDKRHAVFLLGFGEHCLRRRVRREDLAGQSDSHLVEHHVDVAHRPLRSDEYLEIAFQSLAGHSDDVALAGSRDVGVGRERLGNGPVDFILDLVVEGVGVYGHALEVVDLLARDA